MIEHHKKQKSESIKKIFETEQKTNKKNSWKKTTIMTKKFITKIPHFKKNAKIFLVVVQTSLNLFLTHSSLSSKKKAKIFLFSLSFSWMKKKHTQNTQYIIRTDRYGGLDFIYYYQVCRLFDHLHLP